MLAEFRANRVETDPAKVKDMIGQAQTGLTYLKTQTGLGNASGSDLNYSYDAS